MNKKNMLDDFIVKDDELDESLLTEIIQPYLSRIIPDGTPEYTSKFKKLSVARKLLIEILTQKIKLVKKVANTESEEISMGELIKRKNNLDANEGSIKKAFNRELKNITNKGKHGYYVPNYNLQKIKEFMK